MKLYHISEEDLNGQILQPRIPDNFLTKQGYEDNKIPRISLCKSVNGCLTAISANLKNKVFNVYLIDESYAIPNIKEITNNEVPDQSLTEEVWVLNPIKLKYGFKIRVLGAYPKSLKYKYGKDWAETYRWKYNVIDDSDVMTKDKALFILKECFIQVKDIDKKGYVKGVGLFGSTARDQRTKESDVDIFLDLDQSLLKLEENSIFGIPKKDWEVILKVFVDNFGVNPHTNKNYVIDVVGKYELRHKWNEVKDEIIMIDLDGKRSKYVENETNTSIKYIILDCGGVLFEQKDNIVLSDLEKIINREFGPNKSDQEVIDVCHEKGHFITKKDFKETCITMFRKMYYVLDQDIFKKISKLLPNTEIVLLTGHVTPVRYYLEDTYPFKTIDNIFITAEIGYNKEEVKCFEYVLDKLKVEAKDVLFVDDLKVNIDTAKEVGLNVIWKKRSMDTFTEIEKYVKKNMLTELKHLKSSLLFEGVLDQSLLSKSNINPKLKNYVLKNILPLYDRFDKGHNQEHINDVINNALQLSFYYPKLNKDIIFTSAAYHDVGMLVDRETHNIHSAKYVLKDTNLQKFFTIDEIKIIALACRSHRASNEKDLRTVYEKIISDADRLNCYDMETSIRRSAHYNYRTGIDPYVLMELVYEQMYIRYGPTGRTKFHLAASEELVSDQKREAQRLITDKKAFEQLFMKIFREEFSMTESIHLSNAPMLSNVKMNIDLKNNDETEYEVKKLVEEVIEKYGSMIQWFAPNRITIARKEPCYSHPHIHINTRFLRLPIDKQSYVMLAILIHENIHWFEATHPKIQECMDYLENVVYPRARSLDFGLDDTGFWLHIIVNWNTLYLLKHILNNDMELIDSIYALDDIYEEIDRLVEKDYKKIEYILSQYDLIIKLPQKRMIESTSNVTFSTPEELYTFLVEETEYDEHGEHMNSKNVVEVIKLNEFNNFIDSDDFEYNLDRWKKKEIKFLFITGLSGSGKSTLARNLSKKYKSKYIELDSTVDSNIASINFIDTVDGGIEAINNMSKEEYEVAVVNFIFNLYPSEQVIVEGIGILEWFDGIPNIKKHAFIIRGTSRLTSSLRAAKRDGMALPNVIKNLFKNRNAYKYHKRRSDELKSKLSNEKRMIESTSNIKFSTPEELYTFLVEETEYEEHGEHMKTVEEIHQVKTMDCWEAVEFQKYYLKQMSNVKNIRSFFVGLFKKEETELSINWNPYVTHTVSMFEYNNKICWLEVAWQSNQGIFKFNNWNDAIAYFVKLFITDQIKRGNIKEYRLEKMFVLEYFDMPLRATTEQFFKTVFDGKMIYEKVLQKKIKESTSNITFSTPEELYNFLRDETKYKIHKERIQTIEEIWDSRKLDCWEAVEFLKHYLKQMSNVKNIKTYFIGFFKEESNTYNGEEIKYWTPYDCHTVLIYEYNNRVEYSEAHWKTVYRFDNWNQALEHVVSSFIKYPTRTKEYIRKSGYQKLFVYDYSNITIPIKATDELFMEAIFDGKLIYEKDIQEKIKESVDNQYNFIKDVLFNRIKNIFKTKFGWNVDHMKFEYSDVPRYNDTRPNYNMPVEEHGGSYTKRPYSIIYLSSTLEKTMTHYNIKVTKIEFATGLIAHELAHEVHGYLLNQKQREEYYKKIPKDFWTGYLDYVVKNQPHKIEEEKFCEYISHLVSNYLRQNNMLKESVLNNFSNQLSKYNINQELNSYLSKILQKMDSSSKVDKGHGSDHILMVVDNAYKISQLVKKNLNMDIIITAAILHDIGLTISEDKDVHHINSYKYIMKDKELKRFFDQTEIQLIAEIAYDHRASSKNPPRTIYGAIVADADTGEFDLRLSLRRAYLYDVKKYPNATYLELFEKIYPHLLDKYSPETGYANFWLEETKKVFHKGEKEKQILLDKNKTKQLYILLYQEGKIQESSMSKASTKVLYHGSPIQNLKIIEPRMLSTPDQKNIPRVFAADKKIIAIMFLYKYGIPLGMGSVNNEWYIKEKSPNAFDAYKIPGSIYTVKKDSFTKLDSGFDEYVSYEPVEVLKEDKYDNVWNELLKLEKNKKLKLIRYNDTTYDEYEDIKRKL